MEFPPFFIQFTSFLHLLGSFLRHQFLGIIVFVVILLPFHFALLAATGASSS
jgi:hypothetical protein